MRKHQGAEQKEKSAEREEKKPRLTLWLTLQRNPFSHRCPSHSHTSLRRLLTAVLQTRGWKWPSYVEAHLYFLKIKVIIKPFSAHTLFVLSSSSLNLKKVTWETSPPFLFDCARLPATCVRVSVWARCRPHVCVRFLLFGGWWWCVLTCACVGGMIFVADWVSNRTGRNKSTLFFVSFFFFLRWGASEAMTYFEPELKMSVFYEYIQTSDSSNGFVVVSISTTTFLKVCPWAESSIFFCRKTYHPIENSVNSI